MLYEELPEAAAQQFMEVPDNRSLPYSFEECADRLVALNVGVFLQTARIDILSDYSGYQSEIEQVMETLPKAVEVGESLMNDLGCAEHFSSEGLRIGGAFTRLWLWGTFEAMLMGSPGSIENR